MTIISCTPLLWKWILELQNSKSKSILEIIITMQPSKEDNQESSESRIERKDAEIQVSSNLILFDEEFKQSQSIVQNEASSKKPIRVIGNIYII